MSETIIARDRIKREAQQALRNYGAGTANPYPETSIYHLEWKAQFDHAVKSDELEGSAA